MYEIKTQELLPLVDEWRALMIAANEKSQQVVMARDAWKQLQDELAELDSKIASMNTIINHCVLHDMDPTQAKLMLSSDNLDNGSGHRRLPLGVATKNSETQQSIPQCITSAPAQSMWSRIIQAIKS